MNRTFSIIKPAAVKRNLIGHINQFIENSEMKILREVPLDAYKKQSIGNLVTG